VTVQPDSSRRAVTFRLVPSDELLLLAELLPLPDAETETELFAEPVPRLLDRAEVPLPIVSSGMVVTILRPSAVMWICVQVPAACRAAACGSACAAAPARAAMIRMRAIAMKGRERAVVRSLIA